MRRTITFLAVAAGTAVVIAAAVSATAAPRRPALTGEFLLLSDNGMLTRHNAARPQLPVRWLQVTGLADGERLVGMDRRPATGTVYALSSTGQLYTVNPNTGAAVPVGPRFALKGRAIGFDFNPTVDRIRVVTEAGQNLRLHPETGELTADGELHYPDTDQGAGSVPEVAAAAYTNNLPGATTTTLYGVDSARETLVRITPDTGELTTVGALGVAVKEFHTMEIKTGSATDNRAFAAVLPQAGGSALLVEIDLNTGQAGVLSPVVGRPVGMAFLG
ncbi:MAG TPA: DUF4394 domain-containing protein [Actinophytocola sp.]|uniref:DUF4394 domain-containing protein n=1 Tax=Actinophytocola sp. TaxID=1872138 RepID=UPI002DBCCC71|nr:DUF4394 domain-containing protein [Actinophytocola sp.]HEU5472685.1 DUF4394 domain-containing protein [Actinophytocola sp.]